MELETNHLMRRLLQESGIQLPESLKSLDPRLKDIADSPLLEMEGCFFLQALFGEYYDIRESLKEDDRTGLECSINSINIQTIIYTYPEVVNSDLVIEQGLNYAYYLAERLKSIDHFKIIVGYDLGEEPDNYVSCRVRFHLIREDESWLTDNLEDYRLNAILVINT